MTESDFNIQEYLSEGVEIIVKDAMRATLKNPKESIYLLKFSKYARKATKIRQEYEKNGQNIPAFLIASITSSCNRTAQDVTPGQMMHAVTMSRSINFPMNNGKKYSDKLRKSE